MSPTVARRRLAEQALSRSRAQGGLVLLVDGAAGVGKTFFLRELIDLAMTDSRCRFMVSRADEIESSVPYSFIERFIASTGIHDWYFVPDEQTDPVTLARECVQRLAPEPGGPHRVVVVDDAQWIDLESHRVLRYMIPRLARRRVLLAFGARSPHERGSFGEFLIRLVSESSLDLLHTLQTLTVNEIMDLVLERHSAGISTQTAERIFAVTGGSFLGVDSVLSAFTDAEISQLHLAWNTQIRADMTRDDVLLHRYRQLSPSAQRACELVCLAGHELTGASLAATARALEESIDVEAAIAAEVLVQSGFTSKISPRHALVADAISDTVLPERGQAVFNALASITDGHLSLRHTLRGANEWTDNLRGRVLAYIDDATKKRNFQNANEVLRAALGVATDPVTRLELLETLALVNIQANTAYLMIDLLDEIEGLASSSLHEFICVVISAHRVDQAYPVERARRLLTSPAHTPEDRTIVAFLAFLAVLLTMRSKDHATLPNVISLAKMLTEQAPRDPSELADARLAWMVSQEGRLLVLDCYTMVQQQMRFDMDQVRNALPSLIQRIDALPDQSLKIDALVAVAGAKVALGDAEEGYALAQRSVDLLGQVGEPWAASTVRVILADCLVMQGDFVAAIDLIERAESVAYTSLDVEARASLAALRVIIAAITGKAERPAHAAQARRQRMTTWEGYAPDLSALAECELARVHGDAHSVLNASSGEWVENLVNTRHGFLTYRAHALIDVGELGEASALIDQLSAWRGVRWQEYWGSLDWLRARLAQARQDAPTALWHYESAVESQVFPLPLGLALADYGAFLSHLGRGDEAKAAIQSAIRVLEDIGAEGYLPRVRAALDIAPGAPRDTSREALFAVLTSRERQVAEHLGKGRSNNQIAESLVVSVTTVRSHVSNVLRKLQLSSRGQVARLLRDEDPPAERATHDRFD